MTRFLQNVATIRAALDPLRDAAALAALEEVADLADFLADAGLPEESPRGYEHPTRDVCVCAACVLATQHEGSTRYDAWTPTTETFTCDECGTACTEED